MRIKELLSEVVKTKNIKETMVCKDCGDEMHKPTTDCGHDCNDETGSWWTPKTEGVDEAKATAGPDKCWPGYKKVGTKPGTGKNKGKTVNDCERVGEARSSASDQAAMAGAYNGGKSIPKQKKKAKAEDPKSQERKDAAVAKMDAEDKAARKAQADKFAAMKRK